MGGRTTVGIGPKKIKIFLGEPKNSDSWQSGQFSPIGVVQAQAKLANLARTDTFKEQPGQ